MSAITPAGGAAMGRTRPAPGAGQADRGGEAAVVRTGLPVPLGPAPRTERRGAFAAPEGSAPLVAQLIATRMGLPQTRRKRLAAPAAADEAYRAAAGLRLPAAPRRVFSV